MNELERFGGRIADLEEKLETLMRTGIGLGHSSFENGRINQYTNGSLGGSFGTQYDGSNGAVALAGPVPPTPRWTNKWGPMAEGVTGGLRVRWEGFFEGGDMVVATLDHKEVEVHVSTQMTLDGFNPDTLKTTMTSARGGEVLIPLPQHPDGYYVRLVARTHPGKRSEPSTVLGPFHPQKIREEDLGFKVPALDGSQLFWGDTAPEGAVLGDLWLKLPEEEAYRNGPGGWALVADQGVVEAMKNAIGDELATDGSKFQINSGAISPKSLVARDIIATGTVSAGLLEAILVLATVIVAGDPDRTHVKIKNDGVYVYTDDPIDGVPNEVIRMGTATNDFFGITDANGMLIASLDDTGAVNGRTANFREDIVVQGRSLTSLIKNGANHHYAWADGSINSVQTEVGIFETAWNPTPNHMYWIVPMVSWSRDSALAELQLRVRRSTGVDAPSVSTPDVPYLRQFNNIVQNGYGGTASSPGLWVAPPDSDVVLQRFLLTAQRGGSGVVNIQNTFWPTLVFVDLGPSRPVLGSVNRGGGNTAPPTRQYDTGEFAPAGWVSYRGDLSARTDVGGPVQGWDPSGYNGNGKGYWWWNLPDITGTVDRVDLYLYSDHWYYSSGGTAIINAVPWNLGGPNFTKARTDWYVGGFPKPGGKWVTLPADWFPLFHNNGAYGYQRVTALSVGPGPGSDLNYYGKFNGSAARLRIWYTQ